jgi:hypothetical protein
VVILGFELLALSAPIRKAEAGFRVFQQFDSAKLAGI